MLLSIKIGLIHREGVDQMFNLMVCVGPKDSKIRSKRIGLRRRYSLGNTTIDVISPVVSKNHSRAAIKKFADAPDFLWCQLRRANSVSLQTCHSDLTFRAGNPSDCDRYGEWQKRASSKSFGAGPKRRQGLARPDVREHVDRGSANIGM